MLRLPSRQGLLFACTLALLLPACQDKKPTSPGDGQLPAVVVAPVTSKPVSSSTEFIGQSVAVQKVDLRARVTGFLNERPFEEGTDVAEDALLFVIDPSEYEANKKAAAAKVERSEATLLEATRNLERYRVLEQKGTASPAKLDEAIAREGQARADVAAARAELARAELDLGYTKIASPIAGRVGRSSVDKGNLIGPDSGVLATVVTLDPIHITFAISERVYLDYQQRVKEGTAADLKPRLRLANNTLYPHDGKFDFVDNQVDAATGTIKVRLEFPNPEALLLPGQFVNVALVSATPQESLVVPQAAVQQNQAGDFVLVVDKDSKVELRPITTGDRSGTEIVVTDGLTEGELIIVDGIQKVRPGAKVRPVQRKTAAAQ